MTLQLLGHSYGPLISYVDGWETISGAQGQTGLR